MANCVPLCTSDLTHRITLYSRNLLPSSQIFDQDPTQSLTIVAMPWARCKTGITFRKGDMFLDGINTDLSTITHQFSIRYIPGITSEMKLLCNGIHYDIAAIENVGEENKVLHLFAKAQGESAKAASLV